MMKVYLDSVLNKLELSSFNRLDDDLASCDFISRLYMTEPKPIFEHSHFHVLSYLNYQSRLYAITGQFGSAILVEQNNQIFLFTPMVVDYQAFRIFINAFQTILDIPSLEVRNVSENWVERFSQNYSDGLKGSIELRPRSKEEVVYDVESLIKMEGSEFSYLRRAVNRLIKTNKLRFVPVCSANINDALDILSTWQRVQGYKYPKNRMEKEKAVLIKFLDFSSTADNFKLEIAYMDDRPVSVYALYKVPHKDKWGTAYLTKGINRSVDGGTFGVSDATYYRVFQVAKEWGIERLNDGELGTEMGTRAHKLKFQPVEYLKSFDLVFCRRVN